MTKVSVFGQETEKKKREIPIEFVKIISARGNAALSGVYKPEHYDNVMLYRKSNWSEFDLILAWDNIGYNRNIYLGHWNDGFVK